MNLLEIVQEVLDVIDGDQVNSISDTDEAEQVATIARSVYRNLMTGNTWAHNKGFITVVNTGDPNRPNYLNLPRS